MRYQEETLEQSRKLTRNTVAFQAHRLGMDLGEPLIVAMDALLRYAKAYRQKWASPLQNDEVLGPEWLAAVQGIRGLLNGDGAIAMERDISTDSKDNGCVEGMFWDALKAAGFEEKDL